MTADSRTQRIAERAAELATSARADFIARECGDDAVLRAQVDALLQARTRSDAGAPLPAQAAGPRSGQRLGVWRLGALIGSGGMGSVYRAERADGAFAKPVAIKLLLFDAGEMRARFAIEQRVLGALSHPNIASLIDAGLDDNGAPYLVMEYVEGETITAYANRHDLDLRARLGLFQKILDAVQAAHLQLIVHRDIKPGNVLVDAHGEPKLMDFGIAKLIGDNQPAATLTGLGPLTPEYASPEQVLGGLLGPASDVYSLGVLLFELLTGERPYHVAGMSMIALERVILESDPPRPSTRLLTRSVRGNARDLDAIVFKAMAKVPAHRYASAAAFGDDIRHWLAGREILARQPPIAEQATRWLRRHRLLAAVTVTAIITLLAGTVAALHQAGVAREQAQIATNERNRAERINEFLSETLAAASPENLGRKATVMQALDRARDLAGKKFENDPRSATDIQTVLARTYRSLGDLDAAQSSAEAALVQAHKLGDATALIEATSALGNVYLDKGNLPKARAAYSAGYDEASAHGNSYQRGTAALQMGQIENAAGNPREAQSWLQRSLDLLPHDAVLERASALDSSGNAAANLGDKAASIALREQAIAMLRKAYPQGHPNSIAMSVNLAQAYEYAGRTDEALTLLNQVLPQQIQAFGENSSDVVWTLTTLASIARRHDRDAEALGYAQRASKIAQGFRDDNDWKAYAFEKFGSALNAASRPREALPVLQQALTIDRAMLPADHHQIATVEAELALAQSLIDGKPTGLAQAQAAYDRLVKKYGADSQYSKAVQARLERIRSLAH